jgi:hypothetical protein
MDIFSFFFFSILFSVFYHELSFPVHLHMLYIYFASFGVGCVYFLGSPCFMYPICIKNIDL